MKLIHRWFDLALTLWLAIAITGCVASQAHPNGNTKPQQAYYAEFANLVALPRLDNRLAFTQEGTLFSANTDGTNMQVITHTITVSGRATWSPDGAYLATAEELGEGTDIFILPLDHNGKPTNHYNMTHSPDIQESSPTWSPDQHNIAYSAVRAGNWGVYVLEVGLFGDYREPMVFGNRRVSQHAQSLRYKGDPVWSPDGTTIAYTSDVGKRWQLTTVIPYYTETLSFPGTAIPLAGSGLPSSAVNPCWSPDGSKLVFSANPNGNWDLFTVSTDGTGLKPLTGHAADDWNPAWSPDGSWIAFTSNRSGNSDIYLITADGTSIAQLTTTPESEDFATWLPLQPTDAATNP